MPDTDSATQQAPKVLDALYRAIESFDASAVRAALRPDVFVFTPTADGLLTSADAVVKDIEGWSRAVARHNALREPRRIPALYSTRADHVTIGSVVDEIFLGYRSIPVTVLT